METRWPQVAVTLRAAEDELQGMLRPENYRSFGLAMLALRPSREFLLLGYAVSPEQVAIIPPSSNLLATDGAGL